jgi:hypothetical protein
LELGLDPSRELFHLSLDLNSRGTFLFSSYLTDRDTFRSTHHGKRDVCVTGPKLDYAFAFDIDGVLMLGSNTIPAGARALKILHERKIPYILLTNGGGKWEPDRVAELSDYLGVNVPLNLCQC